MSENTNIEWTDSTFNPWMGCTKVSPACDHCYAEVSTPSRTLGVTWGAGQERRRTSPANWSMPLRWNAQAEAFWAQHGRRQRVFCASLADVFDNEVPDEWRADLFNLIDSTPSLDWLLLTKRIGNVKGMLRKILRPDTLPANVWLGATIANQEEADRDIPKLLAVPARVRFLSMEPLLGNVDLNGHTYSLAPGLGEGIDWLTGKTSQFSDIYGGHTSPWLDRGDYDFPEDYEEPRIHWVIVGGESGNDARPMHPDWARSLRDQCASAGVAFLFKQWGEWTPGENVQLQRGTVDGAWWVDARWMPSRENLAAHDGHRDDEPDLYRVGKKAAGRLLDGVQHDGYPL
jgi:protein gp37